MRGTPSSPAGRPGRVDDSGSAARSGAPRRGIANRSRHGDVVSRDPVPIGESLDSVVRSLHPEASLAQPSSQSAAQMGGVFGRWSEAVGDAVAEHVTPIKLDGTKLVGEVDDPAWATQLRFLETTLKQRLQDVAGAVIETVEVRVKRR